MSGATTAGLSQQTPVDRATGRARRILSLENFTGVVITFD